VRKDDQRRPDVLARSIGDPEHFPAGVRHRYPAGDRRHRKSMVAEVDIRPWVCVMFFLYERDNVKQAREIT
jgi:uncharacterized ParB-like nuclease family protein